MGSKNIIFNIGYLSIFIMLFFICSSGFVSAVSLSSDYHDKNPLIIGSGETKEVVFGRLHNPENESKVLKIELVNGKDIASLIDFGLDAFEIPSGKSVSLNARVSIPKNAYDNYTISVNYIELRKDSGGMVTIAQSKTSSIPVIVNKGGSSEPVKNDKGELKNSAPESPISQTPLKRIMGSSSIIWFVFVIILIIFIIFIVYMLIRINKTNNFRWR